MKVKPNTQINKDKNTKKPNTKSTKIKIETAQMALE